VAGYSSLAQAMHAILASAGAASGKHRKARVQRFIFRHPRKHRVIIRKLVRMQKRHQIACRFRATRIKPQDKRR
jgi:hypothetical protein